MKLLFQLLPAVVISIALLSFRSKNPGSNTAACYTDTVYKQPGDPYYRTGITPCDAARSLTNNPFLSAALDTLKTKLDSNYEYGFVLYKDGTRYFKKGTADSTGIEFTASELYNAACCFHTHKKKNLKVHSWPDIVSLTTILDSFRIGVPPGQFQFGLLTDSGTYVLTINNMQRLNNFTSLIRNKNESVENAAIAHTYNQLVSEQASVISNEKGLVTFLVTAQSGIGLTLVKLDERHHRFKPLRLDEQSNLEYIPCK